VTSFREIHESEMQL